MIEQKYPSGRVVRNVLDNDGDLSMVQSKRNANSGYWNYAKSFTYTAAGAVSSMQYGNSKWESTVFNSRLQPTQIALGSTQTATDNLKLNFTYNTTGQNDNNGNVLSQTITVPTVGAATGFTAIQTYTYDSLNRIKDAKEMIGSTQEWKQTFKYDRYGNRSFDEGSTSGNYLTTTLQRNCSMSAYNPNGICDKKKVNPKFALTNRIEQNQDGTNDYLFDSAGNTTKDASGQKFIYDAENKQIEVKDANNVTIGKYFYDGDGKRVKKIVPATGETTIFIYDASGKMVAEYSTIIASAQDAKVSYLTADHLGSPRITTDQNGAVVSRRDFQPFGEEIQRANYGTDDVRQKFTGYERDEESQLDFAQARMYASKLGRFTTTDPLFFQDDRLLIPQRFNLFVYVANNPMRYIDPNGLSVVVAGVGKDNRVKDINNRDGGKFKVETGQNDVLQIVNEKDLDVSKLNAREKAFYDAIKDPNNQATLKGVAATDDFQFGAYGPYAGENAGTNLVDNGDLELLRNQSNSAAAEVVLHEVMEAYAAAKDTQGGTVDQKYNRHHAEANQFTGNVQNIAGDGNPAKITPILATQNPQTFSGVRETVQIKTPTQTIRWDQTIVFKKNLTPQQLVPYPPKAAITIIENKQIIK